MAVKKFSSHSNPFRTRILELIRKNNHATNPSIQEMTNKWITGEECRKLNLEEATEKFYEERSQQILVIEEEGELKGFFLLEENDEYIKKHLPEYWPHLEISLAITAEKHRNKGIARKLLNHTQKEIAGELDHENLVWITSSKNHASQKFATRHGFKKSAKLQDDRDDNLHTLIYTKKI